MMVSCICLPLQNTWDRASHRCHQLFPCLADPARRSSLGLKVALVMLHLIYAGILFLFDGYLIEKTKTEPWYTALYLFLFLATLAQYFITSGSSPGYVLDAMRAVNETNVLFRKASASTTAKQPASSKIGSVVTLDGNQLVKNLQGNTPTSWSKLVMEMYPSGTSIRTVTCSYCNVEQPPRAKHCHDCDKCVLQFDHHCVWLGTCIGQNNHCRFWWYICEETALCLWTGILYITYLKADNISRTWWKVAIVISLLVTLAMSLIFLLLLLLFHSYLVMTNQTTYELVRRRRIPYLRGIPERVYPFSKGVCRNLYNFCCAGRSKYFMEPLPTVMELEQKSIPYRCLDVITCRCC